LEEPQFGSSFFVLKCRIAVTFLWKIAGLGIIIRYTLLAFEGGIVIFGRRMKRSFEGAANLALFAIIFGLSGIAAFAQAGVNTTGNGGRHIIQGRIYGDSGRRVSIQGLKVNVKSFGQGDLSVFVDSNGTFVFRNLVPGTYIVTIAGTETFEPVTEQVYIDAPTGSSSLAGAPRVSGGPPVIVPLQIFLKPKRAEALRNEVLNTKWSAIPHSAVQHYKRGSEFMEAGKDSEAEAEFRSAIGIAPNFAPAHTELGNLAQKAGKFDSAAASFKDAIRYDASDFEANVGLGIAYFNLKKFDDAEAPLVNAAYLDTAAIMPHYYLGLIYSVRNNAEVAQKAFEKVRELGGGKSFPIIHKYLGRIYSRQQLNKQAIAEFETYLSLLPAAKDAEAIKKEIADIKGRLK